MLLTYHPLAMMVMIRLASVLGTLANLRHLGGRYRESPPERVDPTDSRANIRFHHVRGGRYRVYGQGQLHGDLHGADQRPSGS